MFNILAQNPLDDGTLLNVHEAPRSLTNRSSYKVGIRALPQDDARQVLADGDVLACLGYFANTRACCQQDGSFGHYMSRTVLDSSLRDPLTPHGDNGAIEIRPRDPRNITGPILFDSGAGRSAADELLSNIAEMGNRPTHWIGYRVAEHLEEERWEDALGSTLGLRSEAAEAVGLVEDLDDAQLLGQ